MPADSLTVYTVPARWVGSRCTGSNYERIVGIQQTPDQTQWSPRIDAGDVNGHYDQATAQPSVLEATASFNERLLAFFDKYLSRTNGESYNCHTFGRWMIGDKAIDDSEFYYGSSIDQTIDEDRIRALPLLLGEHGVLGAMVEGEPEAFHSIVGLDDERCIQIMGFGGYLGISSYDEVTHYYGRSTRNDIRFNGYGVYV